MNLHMTCHLPSANVDAFAIAGSDTSQLSSAASSVSQASLQFRQKPLTDMLNVTQASRLSMT